MLLAGILLSGIRQPGGAGNEAVAQDAKTVQQQTAAAEKALDQARAAKARAQLAAAQAQAAKAQASAKSAKFDLSYVPATSTMLIGARLDPLASHKTLRPIIEMLEKDALARFGLKVADVDQVLAVGFQVDGKGPAVGPQPVVILNLKSDSKASIEGVVKGLARGETTAKTHNGMKYEESNGAAFYSPNAKTLISGHTEMVTWLMDATKDGPGRHVWSKQFEKVSSSDFVYVIDMAAMKPEIENQMARMKGNPMVAAFSPLWQETKLVVLGAGLTGDSLLDLTAVCGSEEGAKKVQQTAQSLVPLGKNMLEGAKAQMRKAPPESQKVMADLFGFAETSLDNMEFTQAGNTARLQVKSEGEPLPVLFALLLPAVQSAREAARRTQSSNNLKQIGLAFHNYHDTYKKFPGSTNLGPDGKTVHSWRVAILPFLEQKKLYEEYNLNEPWDSENNKKILDQMPQVYRNPSANNTDNSPNYFGLTGPSAGLGEGSGESIRTFIDGTSNTILIVGAKREIPWTKPEDIAFDPEKDLPKFGGYHPGGFQVVLADGSVRFLATAINKDTLKALLTRNGKEVIPEF